MKSIKKTLTTLALITGGIYAQAQTEGVSIKTSLSPPHPSAMLDVESGSKGLLIPRVDLKSLINNVNPVLNPSNSLLVFNNGTNLPKGYYYWEQTTPTAGTWIKLGTGTGSGSSLWAPIGTTADIYYAAGKVRIGASTLPAPTHALEVKTTIGDNIFKFEGVGGSLSANSGGAFFGSSLNQRSSAAGLGTLFTQTYSDGKEGITLASVGTNNSWTTVNYSEILAGGNNALYVTSQDKVIIHSGKVAGQWVSGYFFNQNGTMTSFSDSLLKINVISLSSVINKIKQCRPVMYNWKLLPDAQKMHGFIAQELERIFPELIVSQVVQSGSSQTTLKTVNYLGMISILVKAIKEQQQQIENQNSEHQIQINALTQRIIALENK